MSRNENAPEKSNFTRRCSLLSRYLKENGSFGNIDLGLLPKPNSNLVLLPAKSDIPGKQNAMKKAEHSESKDLERVSKGESSTSFGGKVKDADLSETEPGSSQLTIFFGGKVIVYNEFPANKANEIMQVAKQTKPLTLTVKNIQTQINIQDINNNKTNNMVLPDLNEPTNSAETHLNHPTKQQQQQQQQQEQNQLVERIARRASLHRFFAKRKDRAVARAPYQVNQNAGHHRYPPKAEMEAGQPLEPGQSSQRPDNAVAQTMAHPKSDGDKDSMDVEEGQSSKDLELRL
ncbi:Protein TIFY 11A [Cardamine amara subsp. amara]|uniref:Protein TIFY n=1 Tax=Cardamine amara subsp. amara TaxID=228776 RepID=A0ABD1C3Q7_CARAN